MVGCSSEPAELQWNEAEGYRWAELPFNDGGEAGFDELAPSQTGIDFENRITDEDIDNNQHFLNGSGVAAGDIDGDGLVDLYFARLNGPNKLYKNLGNMKFQDITEEAGVAHEEYYSTGVTFADINGNGHLDLLVTSMHKENVVYINDGNGNFERLEDSGLGLAKGSMTMTLADITGNGYLDLYIANYKEHTVKDIYTTEELDWANILNEPYNRQQQEGPYSLVPPFDEHYEIFMTDDNRLAGLAETGEEDELYLNRGGMFEKVSDTGDRFLDQEGEPYGLQPDWGLTAKFQDLNNDGLTDLYVCNDFFTKDKVWINQGEGTFKQIHWSAMRNLSFACMGVDFSDINRDGYLDIFTAEMLSPTHEGRLQQVGEDSPYPDRVSEIEWQPTTNRNSMFLQREDETYAEISYLSGVEGTGWSWDATFLDVDLDGYEDILVSTGYLSHILDIDSQIDMAQQRMNMDEHFMEFMKQAPTLDIPNKILMNNGDLTFEDRSIEMGFEGADISHGMAVADLNNDGTLDVVTSRMNQAAGVYVNRSRAPRIAVRLKGEAPNTQAVGAKVELAGGPVVQRKEISSGGSFASGSDPLVVFAADEENPDHRLTIRWPDGQQTVIDSLKASRIYEIEEPEIEKEQAETAGESGDENTLFRDVSERIDHEHHEDPFTDFEIQPLLPFSLGTMGPGVAWIDYNNDGRDELFVASGKGAQTGIFDQDEGTEFSASDLGPLSKEAAGDQTTILGWKENNNTRMVVGSANYEQGTSAAPSVFIYEIDQSGAVSTDSLQGIFSTTGPLAAADVNEDGYIDLFVGGRLDPGQYPRDSDSRLFRNEEGLFQLDASNSRLLTNLGLATGAVFTDYNRDGTQDLLISTEWGSLKLFENRDGSFRDVTEEVGLDDYKGWWKGVATGDFTNNGLPDIVATNIGLNSPYKKKYGYPLRLYYEDLSGNGRMDMIDAYADEEGNYVPRERLHKYRSARLRLNRMDDHTTFSESTLEEILGERIEYMPYKEINTLQHMIFINTGDGFEAHPLPVEAQFTAGFHASVADFDNDGNEDLFLSQNFFGVSSEIPRMDAGRGMVLTGDGNGSFTPLEGSESGIKIYGEQRGAALNDINRDGKVDLAVSQNRSKSRLFLNQTDSEGYRIALEGPAENGNGIGSSIRLVYSNGEKGPLREIQSGSGYWSQNSFTQVMGAAAEVTQIEVLWFDGTNQTAEVNEGQKTYVIEYPEGQN